jgi:SAM-dependent methyltransferase
LIGVATDKARKQGADVNFQVGLIERLPSDDGTFDLALSNLMLHHLPADLQRRGLAEVKRVLRKDGRFVAVDVAPPKGLSRQVLTPLLGNRMMQAGVGHLQRVLAGVGFTKVETGPTRMRVLAYLRAGRSPSEPSPLALRLGQLQPAPGTRRVLDFETASQVLEVFGEAQAVSRGNRLQSRLELGDPLGQVHVRQEDHWSLAATESRSKQSLHRSSIAGSHPIHTSPPYYP